MTLVVTFRFRGMEEVHRRMASSVNIDGQGRLILYDRNRAIIEDLTLAELSDVSIDSVGAEQIAAPAERGAVAVCVWPRPVAIVTGAPLGDARSLIEGVQVRFDLLWVIVAFKGVTEQEAGKFQEGEIGLYLQEIDGLISLAVNVEDVIWCDGVFTAQSGGSQALPEPAQGYLLKLVLVDLPSRIVRAWRAVAVGPEFSQALFTLWLMNRHHPALTDHEFRRRAAALSKRFTSPKELASRAPYQYRSPHTDAAGETG